MPDFWPNVDQVTAVIRIDEPGCLQSDGKAQWSRIGCQTRQLHRARLAFLGVGASQCKAVAVVEAESAILIGGATAARYVAIDSEFRKHVIETQSCVDAAD